jgi:hypothetical protein
MWKPEIQALMRKLDEVKTLSLKSNYLHPEGFFREEKIHMRISVV